MKTWYRLEYRAANLRGIPEGKSIEFSAENDAAAIEQVAYYRQPGKLPSDAERFVLFHADEPGVIWSSLNE